MDFVDVDSAKFKTYAEQDRRQPLNWVHNRDARMLAAYEAKIARRADASLFVSEAEAALFRAQSGLGADKVRAAGTGIDTGRFDPAPPLQPVGPGGGALAGVTGEMGYRPYINVVRRVAWIGNRECG